MRTALAEKLLVKIMEWNSSEISKERPLIQALSNLKYNEYQQFSIGTKFIESLVKWLKQFDSIEERQIAYNFLKSKLIFISNDQMLHLVNITFSDKINPFLIQKTAKELNISHFLTKQIINSPEYKKIIRRSLFIGLSDGSRIDQLRRYSSLDNEQVIPTYQINQEKVDDMLSELKKSNIIERYNTIFLIDDFTASGTSYFRTEGTEKKGKIYKTIRAIYEPSSELYQLIDKTQPIDIKIIFYIATEESINKLKNEIEKWKNESCDKNFNFTIDVIQIIDEIIKLTPNNDNDFIELSKKYIDSDIVDKHFKKAKHENYFLGYNECALPLVLVHNTPNNSMPLLWQNSKNFVGLFPRVTRHK
ncbi:phosphoribosyltransferase-like protein [Flavobacterium sp. C4GT6]|uniref:phosphoribosyltransferase-like protein n=1 Tax=Flavobacterium sp. C4GT6 TaxID=3103818 RepID=UPI002ED2D6E7